MKHGLILEGGGLRGLFTAGLLDSWMQNSNIRFDAMMGVSAGALFGCNFKSHQIGRALRYNIKLKNDPRYMGLRCLLKTGNIVAPEFCYHTVPTVIDPFDNETFKNDPTEFYCTVTDIETGKPVYKLVNSFDRTGLEWMRATGSMPLVSTPVPLEGHLYLDGGMTDSIPLEAFQNMGFERNVVVLTRPKGYRKEASHITWLFRLFCHKYPHIADAMKHRHEVYNKELEYIAEQEKLGNTLLIFPETNLDIGRIELKEDKMTAVHQAGLRKGDETIKAVLDFLKDK